MRKSRLFARERARIIANANTARPIDPTSVALIYETTYFSLVTTSSPRVSANVTKERDKDNSQRNVRIATILLEQLVSFVTGPPSPPFRTPHRFYSLFAMRRSFGSTSSGS